MGTSLDEDGTFRVVGSSGGSGPTSACRRRTRPSATHKVPGPAPKSGDSSSSPSTPSRDGNCTAPLRARPHPPPPGRIRIPGRRGGDAHSGCSGGTGSLWLGRRCPAQLRPLALPGRCSPRPRDEPGEREEPQQPLPRGCALMGNRVAAAAASVPPGCVTLGSPAPSLGPSPEGQASRRRPFRVPARTSLGAGEAPRRRGLATGSGCLITAWDQLGPGSTTYRVCDLDGVPTLSSSQFPYL